MKLILSSLVLIAISILMTHAVRADELKDVNGDGKLDLVYTNHYGNLIAHYGDGHGGFKKEVARIEMNKSTEPQVLNGDFNNDGVEDSIVIGRDSESVQFLDGEITFQDPIETPTGFTFKEVNIGDMDGDGLLDLVFTGLEAGTGVTLVGDGWGHFFKASTK